VVSIYRCDLHGQRIRGSLEGIRITLLTHATRFTRKLRVCPVDLDAVLERHSSEWEYVPDEGLSNEPSVSCARCNDDSADTRLVSAFIHVWRRGKPADEWFAEYCDGCAAELVSIYGLVEEDAQRENSRAAPA